MVEIRAFKGIHYNPEKFKDASKLVAPPYDVINEELQDELYAGSEFNFARIIKGKEEPGDNDSSNKYTRAAGFLEDWLEQKVLIHDPEDSIYIYSQEFEAARKKHERTGFIALVKLEGYGKGVMPHEFTLKGPKADRLNLMTATKAHTGQIFCLYPDPDKTIDTVLKEGKAEGSPILEATDSDGIIHRLWGISDPAKIEKITATMSEKQLFIADGHHRYETANNFMNENPELESAKYGTMTFVNMQNEGLLVLPTHRLVKNLKDFDIALLEEKLKTDFELEAFEYTAENEADVRKAMFDKLDLYYNDGRHSFGMYCNNSRYYLVSLASDKTLAERTDIPEVLKKLDVTILHSLILDDHLGIDKEKLAAQENVEYIKDTGTAIHESIDMVNSGKFQLVFFMNPPKVTEIELVAGGNEKMPQKSTFFYPKVYSGFVVYKM